MIDPDGNENIIIVGNQGYSPGSDKNGNNYRYGQNKRHFLEAGLNEAKNLKKHKTTSNEVTTMIVFAGDYAEKELKAYKTRAEKLGINFKIVYSSDEVADYVNNKNGNNSRNEDLITDLSYIGHGWTESLLIGYNYNEDELSTKNFNSSSFDLKAEIYLNACASGYDVMDDCVNRLTSGKVKGYKTTTIWGEKGLGSSRAYDKFYYPPGDLRRNSDDRLFVPENDRIRIENGTRTE